MELKHRIKQSKATLDDPPRKAKDIWLYLVVLILVVANLVIPVELIKYLSARQNSKNIDRLADNYAQNVSKLLTTRLNAEVEETNSVLENGEITLPLQTLDNYLSEIDETLLGQIIVADRDGSIIAASDRKVKDRAAVTSENILTNLQKLGELSDLDLPLKLNLKIEQQNLSIKVIPWQNQRLDLNWLLIVIISESDLLANSAIEQGDLRSRYLIYALPTVVSGLLALVATILLVRKSQRLAKNKLALFQKNALETEEELKQLLASKDLSEVSSEIIIDEPDNFTDSEPYLLLANMSHELRSPLNAILGFAQIMEQELPTTESNQENIAIISRSGERLLSIVNDVVDLAKIETNQLALEQKNLDLYAWLDNLEQSFKFQACNQDWELFFIREDNLPQYICIDERRLRQIVGSLVDYCLESKSSAKIDIEVTSSQEQTEISEPNPNGKYDVCFAVKNSDFPVSTTELSTLFDPITRVKQERKSHEGSSLNLPISRKLSQLMGGDLIAKDTDEAAESGIVFNLTIKAESITPQELPIKPTVRRIIGLESDQIEYRILVVDDSKTNRKIMLQLLESVGFKVKEAVNGSEAIDVWLSWQPHMIWMDLRMPVMDGCEATERIRSYSRDTHPRIPIVALSASTLEEEKSLFKAAGCDDFVGKPFSENIIFDKIAQHLGIRYVYEPIISPEPSNFRLTADTLKVMPKQWLNQIEQAAIELDRDLLTQLLQEIPSEHAELKNALQKQVNNFDFDRILNLARESQSKEHIASPDN